MSQAKTIVWMSRHAPLPSQIAELERLFPGHTLVIEKRPFSSAKQIMQRFHEAGANEMVTVAPWSVIRELIKLGIKPIYAEMKQVPAAEGETTVVVGRSKKKRYYKFLRFAYCTDVSLTLIPIEPPFRKITGKQTVLLDADGSTKSIIKT